FVAGIVLYSATRTYVDYFGNWANRVDVYRGYDTGLSHAASYLNASVNVNTPLYLYVDRSPPLLFLAPVSRAGRWLQEYSNLLLVPKDAANGVVYVYGGDGSLS